MQQDMRCWVCGRGTEEIRAIMVEEDSRESEFDKQQTQVAWFRSKLNESASAWRRALPREFRDMDFNFVVGNPDQFRSFAVISSVSESRKVTMDWLAKASTALRKGDEVMLEDLRMSSLEGDARAAVLKSLEQFEGRWHRLLAKEEGQDARGNYPAGFDGLSLADGLEYLIAGGSLYYDMQDAIVRFARIAEESKKPKPGVKAVQLAFGPVPVCDICSGMISELRLAREAGGESPGAEIVRPEPEVVRPEPEPAEKPEPVAPKVVRPGPRRTRAQPQPQEAEDPSTHASPGYLEIIKKLGPTEQPAESATPKPRYLHEHRLKEDWDEVLEAQKSEGS